MEEIWKFVQSVGNAFVPSYLPILERRHREKWGERERRWQQLRRGRYVEFNLVNDRGTKVCPTFLPVFHLCISRRSA